MQRIGIGYEFYKKFVDEKLYYVDKTLLIRDVLKYGGETTLFLRPRRFGKTLALTTLQTFFEQEYDREGNIIDNSRYFEGKKIMETGDEVLKHMGQYPVIFMTLKSGKQPDFDRAFYMLRDEIIRECNRHYYLLSSKSLTDEEKDKLLGILRGGGEWRKSSFSDAAEREKKFKEHLGLYANAIQVLSECLQKHHGKKTVILIDEYDVPLENAYFSGFYDEMLDFIRSFFECSLKTNTALERAVITGCLRISRESIFTGLNNLKINSMLGDSFAEGFGFTQEETGAMLIAYGLKEKTEEVKDWYNGYLFGETEVYNPWSVTNYVDGYVNEKRKYPIPYWSNTSSNSIVKDLVEQADEHRKKDLEQLIGGGTIEKRIHEDVTYDSIYDSEDNLWNFLFFTGYMRKVAERFDGKELFLTMRIPNNEVGTIYEHQVRKWFDNIVKKTNPEVLYRAIREKDCACIGDFVTTLLEQSISTFDSSESFFHGFFLSLVSNMGAYGARSNREAGTGRPDIVMIPDRRKDPVYLFECKVCKKYSEMENGLEEAFTQIRDMHYEEGLLDDGYAGVVSYGICFCKKSCIVGLKP